MLFRSHTRQSPPPSPLPVPPHCVPLPQLVGVAQGVKGFCTALSALPAGALADAFRRDTVCRVCGAFGLAAIVTTFLAVLLPPVPLALTMHGYGVSSTYLLLCLALGLWGLSYGALSVVEAIYADSVPTGAEGQ